MKNYTITVNGNVYDVVVEEGASTGAPVAMALRQQHRLREQQHLHRLRQQNRQLQAQQEAFPSQQAQQVK